MFSIASIWIAFIIGILGLTFMQAQNSVASSNGLKSIGQWFRVQSGTIVFRWLLDIGVFGVVAHAPQVAQRLAAYQLKVAWPLALLAGLLSESLLSIVVYGYLSKIPGFGWLKTDMSKLVPPPKQPEIVMDGQLTPDQEKK